MTPVARVVLGVALVAGAGPAGFLIFHIVFDGHPLPSRQLISPASGPTPTLPPAPPPSTRAAEPLTLPDSVALPDRNGRMHHLPSIAAIPWC